MIANIPDEDDPKWEMDEPIELFNGEDWIIPPSPYMAGMLTDDPLFEPVMNSSNPAALVSMLAELGYPVATAGRPLEGGGESDQTCGEDTDERRMLVAMANGVEWGMTQSVTDELTGQFATDGVSSFLPACIPALCVPWWTTTTGPIIPTANCYYSYVGVSITTTPGGFTATCSYEARRQFKQNRTITGTRLDCSTYTCSQIRLGWAAVPVTCPFAVPAATPFTCSPQPSCVGPASANAVCTATFPTFWNPWGPPCP
jgi:hypothetical protein